MRRAARAAQHVASHTPPRRLPLQVFAEIDGDGDGSITNEEFINGIGMLKREVLEIMQLEASFTRLREKARKPATGGSPRNSGGDVESGVGGRAADDEPVNVDITGAVRGACRCGACPEYRTRGRAAASSENDVEALRCARCGCQSWEHEFVAHEPG